MAESIQVAAKARVKLGSRENKRLRDAGFIPGVIYGHKEAVVPVTLPRREVSRHLEHGAHLFDLSVEGKSEKVLVKEVQYDHLGIEVLHVDFARVSLDEKVTLIVPLELKGTPKGEADGGVLHQVVAELEIECLVTDIPSLIRHNITELGLNSVLHLKDVVLPKGVKALQDEDLIIATVKEVVEETTTAEGEAEPEVIGKKPEDAAAEAEAAKK